MHEHNTKPAPWMSTPEGMATVGGLGLLAVTTISNIAHGSGWQSTDALVIAGMAIATAAGARVLGAYPKGLGIVGAVLIGGMLAGEAYNLVATGETTMSSRDEKAAPIRQAAQRNADAVKRLNDLLAAPPGETRRLQIARDAMAALETERETGRVEKARSDLKTAREAVEAESRNGCKTTCLLKKDVVTASERELDAALAAQRADRKAAIDAARAEQADALKAADADHKAEVEAAKADVERNPAPADTRRVSKWAWVMDATMATLRSFGSALFAAALIAFGARRTDKPDGSRKSGNPENEVRELPAASNDPGPATPGPAGPGGPKSGKRGRRPNAEVFEFSDEFRKRHGRTPTGPEIRAEFPDLGRTTAYDYAAKVRISG